MDILKIFSRTKPYIFPIFIVLIPVILSAVCGYNCKKTQPGDNLSYFIREIKFKDHSYIHYHNNWNSAGDAFIHDPDCECLKREKS